jgi:AraC-like DNA-binding protein
VQEEGVTAELMLRIFSTAGLPAERRIELWESHNSAALIGLAVHAPGPLDATELNIALPQARLARVTGSAHTVERTPDMISRFPADAVVVYLTLRGDAWFVSADRTLARRPGDAIIWETDRPFTRRFAVGLEELVITVPRSALTARGNVARLDRPVLTSFAVPPGTSAAMGTTGTASRPAKPDYYARALARIAGRAARTGHPLPPDERTVLDLVAVLAAGPKAAPAAAHRASAHLYIEECLTDPGLGADEIAAAIGISARQLSRLFAADGTSLPRHILSRRLELARSILTDPAPASAGTAGTAKGIATARPIATVADVAASCGFTSVTYFSHTFRHHFGHRASDLQRAPSQDGSWLD